MDPLMDFGDIQKTPQASKKAKRIMMQRMTGAEMLMHLFDTQSNIQEESTRNLNTNLSPLEIAEITLHQMCGRLVRLALACRHVPVPQKWIGSSVALGFDAGTVQPRFGGEELARRSTIV